MLADRSPRPPPPPPRRGRTVGQGAALPWWFRAGTTQTSSRTQSPLTDNGTTLSVKGKIIICQSVTQGKVRDVA